MKAGWPDPITIRATWSWPMLVEMMKELYEVERMQAVGRMKQRMGITEKREANIDYLMQMGIAEYSKS